MGLCIHETYLYGDDDDDNAECWGNVCNKVEWPPKQHMKKNLDNS